MSRNISFSHCPDSYPVDTGGSFYEGKVAGNGTTHSQLTEFKKDQNCSSTRMQRLIVEYSAKLL